MPLKAFDARRVIADVSAGRRCLTRDTDFRITNAIKVQPVNVVVLHKMRQYINRIFGGVRMTEVYPEVAAETMTLINVMAVIPAYIGKQSARQPVVGTGNNRIGRGIKAAVQVESVIRILGRKQIRSASPNGAHDDKGVNLDALSMRVVDNVLKRVKARLNRRSIAWRLKRIEIP